MNGQTGLNYDLEDLEVISKLRAEKARQACAAV
jgi:hypothetical protein